MRSDYTLPAPLKGKAYILILRDPDDRRVKHEVWTTKAPREYISSKTYYAHSKPKDRLSAWLLRLQQRGKVPVVILAETVNADEAAYRIKMRAYERARKQDEQRNGGEDDEEPV